MQLKDKYNASRYLHPPTLLFGGGGLVWTARDYMRFCPMLVNKGELQGERILKTETVEMMIRDLCNLQRNYEIKERARAWQ